MSITSSKIKIMKITIWHLLRSMALLCWLILGYSNQRMLPISTIVLMLAIAYGIILTFLLRRNLTIRRRVAIGILIFAAILVHLQQARWDYVPAFIGLYLYLPEVVVGNASWKRRVSVLLSVIVISFAIMFLGLYRIGWSQNYQDASINGRPVPCSIITVPTLSGIIVSSGCNWMLVDPCHSSLKLGSSYRSFFLNHVAVIDVRSLDGLLVDEKNGKTAWASKTSYRNKQLSFYLKPDCRFTCNNIDL